MITRQVPVLVIGNIVQPNMKLRMVFIVLAIINVHDSATKTCMIPHSYAAFSGNRTIEVPSSRIVIIEGIYALSEKLRPILDLRVSVTGGVHFDLVKRVLRDIQRAGQEPEEIIHQISETVCSISFSVFPPDMCFPVNENS